MSRNYKFRDQEKPYFISFATVYWIDVFIRPIYKDILVDSINYCIENKGLIVFGYVIMSSHVHMIIGTKEEKIRLLWRKRIGKSNNIRMTGFSNMGVHNATSYAALNLRQGGDAVRL